MHNETNTRVNARAYTPRQWCARARIYKNLDIIGALQQPPCGPFEGLWRLRGGPHHCEEEAEVMEEKRKSEQQQRWGEGVLMETGPADGEGG